MPAVRVDALRVPVSLLVITGPGSARSAAQPPGDRRGAVQRVMVKVAPPIPPLALHFPPAQAYL
jgi:hypothetical protein